MSELYEYKQVMIAVFYDGISWSYSFHLNGRKYSGYGYATVGEAEKYAEAAVDELGVKSA